MSDTPVRSVILRGPFTAAQVRQIVDHVTAIAADDDRFGDDDLMVAIDDRGNSAGDTKETLDMLHEVNPRPGYKRVEIQKMPITH